MPKKRKPAPADNRRLIPINQHGDGAPEVLIYDTIGDDFWGYGISAKGFDERLQALGDVPEIDVRINSDGGSVFDGVAIYNALGRHPAKINVHIDGLAASIASVIAMAGDTIAIAENAFLMIHKASSGVWGSDVEMRREADLLTAIEKQIVAIYHARSGHDADELAAMMAAETWIDSARAIELGMADQVVANKQVAAHLRRPQAFRNVPAALAPWSGPRHIDRQAPPPSDPADDSTGEPTPGSGPTAVDVRLRLLALDDPAE